MQRSKIEEIIELLREQEKKLLYIAEKEYNLGLSTILIDIATAILIVRDDLEDMEEDDGKTD